MKSDYWMNYGKITVIGEGGKEKRITKLKDFLSYRGQNFGLINPRAQKRKLK